MMKMFSSKKSSAKNVLILGEEGCGKKSFVLYYKDYVFVPEAMMPPITNLLINDKCSDSEEHIPINFILDSAFDGMGSVSSQKKVKSDLVLILVDLSSELFNKTVKFYESFAGIHFPGVATLIVGTKADSRLAINRRDNLIATSAKTGEGFDEFKEEFQKSFESFPALHRVC